MKIGIIGTGWIAEKMAITIRGMADRDPHYSDTAYAVASRNKDKAEAFASKWGFTKAYGSYEELVDDADVDLVYVATPHSHHYSHAMLALEHGKAVLCEKAFTANAEEAQKLIDFAESRNLFITEAIWTRYMPISLKVKELLDSGAIGRPLMINASIGYPNDSWERIVNPALCGGSLLDLGVYVLNFARMYFGPDYISCTGRAAVGETGVDLQNTMSLVYADGRMANLMSTTIAADDLHGVICGDRGFIVVDNVNNPSEVCVYDTEHRLVDSYREEDKITGYEFQVYACEDALSKGWIESPFMPHRETVAIMRQMDALRREWGVVYPNDVK